jgi:hypothetical protein
MKMIWDWQVIINFVLFAMIVTAFVFAIWSYVKTNAIKNSESPSVPTVINDNNTYVNNIASAPNVVMMGAAAQPTSYTLKTTDNGSDILLYPDLGDIPQELTINIPQVLPAGFYVKAININTNPVTLNFVGQGAQISEKIQLAQYQWAYFVNNVSYITNGISGNYLIDTSFPTNGTIL